MVTLFALFGQTNHQKAACRQLCLQIVPPNHKEQSSCRCQRKRFDLNFGFFFFSVSSGWIALSLVGGQDAAKQRLRFAYNIVSCAAHNIHAATACFQAFVLVFEPFPSKVIVRLKDVLSPTVKQ